MLVAHVRAGVQALQILGERALRGGLRVEVEARVHRQARGGEIGLGVIALQVPPHEIDVGRHVAAARRPQAERARERALGGLRIDEMRIREFLQHEIAPRERAIGMLARVVERGPLDQPDEQRELRGLELVQGLGEVILAAESEAVDGARAVLAQIHLVQVRDQNVLFRVVRLETHGHDGLGRLAAEGLLVRQKVVLHELLRQRAAALHDAPGPQVGPDRAQHAERVDAVVLVEAPILDELDAAAQERRNVGRGHDQAVLAVNRKDAADHRRIETEHRQVGAARETHARDGGRCRRGWRRAPAGAARR